MCTMKAGENALREVSSESKYLERPGPIIKLTKNWGCLVLVLGFVVSKPTSRLNAPK